MRAQAGFAPHIHTLGQGPRRALALHCTLAFGGAWNGMAKALGDQITFVAPDMASHGKSVDWDEASDFSDTTYLASLAAMDDAPMDVIGHSFGAATALRLAVHHPERIRTLTIFEPVLFAVALADGSEAITLHDRHATPFFKAFEAGDRAGAARAFNGMWSDGGPPWDTLPDRVRAAMTRAIHVVPDTYGFLYDDAAGLLKSGALDALRVPTLVVRGAQAHPAIIATNDGLAARIPGATQAVIADAGHMAPVSHAADMAQVWQRFLALH